MSHRAPHTALEVHMARKEWLRRAVCWRRVAELDLNEADRAAARARMRDCAMRWRQLGREGDRKHCIVV